MKNVKQKSKKIISFLLTLVMIVPAFPLKTEAVVRNTYDDASYTSLRKLEADEAADEKIIFDKADSSTYGFLDHTLYDVNVFENPYHYDGDKSIRITENSNGLRIEYDTNPEYANMFILKSNKTYDFTRDYNTLYMYGYEINGAQDLESFHSNIDVWSDQIGGNHDNLPMPFSENGNVLHPTTTDGRFTFRFVDSSKVTIRTTWGYQIDKILVRRNGTKFNVTECGSYDGTYFASETTDNNTKIYLGTPTKSGQYFCGWDVDVHDLPITVGYSKDYKTLYFTGTERLPRGQIYNIDIKPRWTTDNTSKLIISTATGSTTETGHFLSTTSISNPDPMTGTVYFDLDPNLVKGTDASYKYRTNKTATLNFNSWQLKRGDGKIGDLYGELINNNYTFLGINGQTDTLIAQYSGTFPVGNYIPEHKNGLAFVGWYTRSLTEAQYKSGEAKQYLVADPSAPFFDLNKYITSQNQRLILYPLFVNMEASGFSKDSSNLHKFITGPKNDGKAGGFIIYNLNWNTVNNSKFGTRYQITKTINGSLEQQEAPYNKSDITKSVVYYKGSSQESTITNQGALHLQTGNIEAITLPRNGQYNLTIAGAIGGYRNPGHGGVISLKDAYLTYGKTLSWEIGEAGKYAPAGPPFLAGDATAINNLVCNGTGSHGGWGGNRDGERITNYWFNDVDPAYGKVFSSWYSIEDHTYVHGDDCPDGNGFENIGASGTDDKCKSHVCGWHASSNVDNGHAYSDCEEWKGDVGPSYWAAYHSPVSRPSGTGGGATVIWSSYNKTTKFNATLFAGAGGGAGGGTTNGDSVAHTYKSSSYLNDAPKNTNPGANGAGGLDGTIKSNGNGSAGQNVLTNDAQGAIQYNTSKISYGNNGGNGYIKLEFKDYTQSGSDADLKLQDINAPNIPTAKIDPLTGEYVTEAASKPFHRRVVWNAPSDIGTRYSFKVEMINTDSIYNRNVIARSPWHTVDVKSEVYGYLCKYDQSPTAVKPSQYNESGWIFVPASQTHFDMPMIENNTIYTKRNLHVCAIDHAGNISEVLNMNLAADGEDLVYYTTQINIGQKNEANFYPHNENNNIYFVKGSTNDVVSEFKLSYFGYTEVPQGTANKINFSKYIATLDNKKQTIREDSKSAPTKYEYENSIDVLKVSSYTNAHTTGLILNGNSNFNNNKDRYLTSITTSIKAAYDARLITIIPESGCYLRNRNGQYDTKTSANNYDDWNRFYGYNTSNQGAKNLQGWNRRRNDTTNNWIAKTVRNLKNKDVPVSLDDDNYIKLMVDSAPPKITVLDDRFVPNESDDYSNYDPRITEKTDIEIKYEDFNLDGKKSDLESYYGSGVDMNNNSQGRIEIIVDEEQGPTGPNGTHPCAPLVIYNYNSIPSGWPVKIVPDANGKTGTITFTVDPKSPAFKDMAGFVTIEIKVTDNVGNTSSQKFRILIFDVASEIKVVETMQNANGSNEITRRADRQAVANDARSKGATDIEAKNAFFAGEQGQVMIETVGYVDLVEVNFNTNDGATDRGCKQQGRHATNPCDLDAKAREENIKKLSIHFPAELGGEETHIFEDGIETDIPYRVTRDYQTRFWGTSSSLFRPTLIATLPNNTVGGMEIEYTKDSDGNIVMKTSGPDAGTPERSYRACSLTHYFYTPLYSKDGIYVTSVIIHKYDDLSHKDFTYEVHPRFVIGKDNVTHAFRDTIEDN